MSQTTNPLPDPQTAYDTLFTGVHREVFFQKLAAHGMAPTTAEEAHWMLDTALRLRAVEDDQRVKRAAAPASPFYRMNRDLAEVMARQGLGGPPAAESEMAVKAAAEQLMADDVIYNSVLSLKAYEADQASRAA